jgi:chromosome segregation ATPase
LKKRETDLYKYKFKIKDLKKSKHVLTHRTADMRASLEPKEQHIENLKDQLLNLEKVFEKQMQEMNGYEDELSKKQSKIN